MKTRKINLEEHKARLASGVCPRCGDHRIVRSIRMEEGESRGSSPKFLGAFYHCAAGHTCWYMSDGNARDLRESSEGTDPVRFRAPDSTPGIVRRRASSI